jgi:hypothetical protein
MAERSVVHLRLDVDLDTEPITGVVGDFDEEGRRFSGWIELTRSIELSLDQARQVRSSVEEDAGTTPAESGP